PARVVRFDPGGSAPVTAEGWSPVATVTAQQARLHDGPWQRRLTPPRPASPASSPSASGRSAASALTGQSGTPATGRRTAAVSRWLNDPRLADSREPGLRSTRPDDLNPLSPQRFGPRDYSP